MLSEYYANQIEDALWGLSTYTPPAGIFVALHTADPGTTGASEVTDAAYVRQEMDTGTAVTSGGQRPNTAKITYPDRTNSWGMLTYFSLWDAENGGNWLKSAALNNPIDAAAGTDLSFEIGALISGQA